MHECEFCGKQCKSKNSLTQHLIRCSQNPDEAVQLRLKRMSEKAKKNKDGERLNKNRITKKIVCKECGVKIDERQFNKHKNSKTCSRNKKRLTNDKNTKSEKWYESMRKKKEKGTASNQYLKAKELGLPKPEISEETRRKRSKSVKEANKGRWTESQRIKHSIIMKKVVEANPDSYTQNNVCGRVKNVEYNGVKLKGSWELKTAKWLDSQSIKWENESQSFPYIWNGKEHRYFPDFYLNDLNVYIEVKGYKTERDEAKWSYFPETLIVIDKKYINQLNELKIENFL